MMCERHCVIAFVATTACRVIFERTKKTSRIGPDTTAVSERNVQMTTPALARQQREERGEPHDDERGGLAHDERHDREERHGHERAVEVSAEHLPVHDR